MSLLAFCLVQGQGKQGTEHAHMSDMHAQLTRCRVYVRTEAADTAANVGTAPPHAGGERATTVTAPGNYGQSGPPDASVQGQ